jgi:hypothetical protein
MPEKGQPKRRNTLIVEAEIKILKKNFSSVFIIRSPFPRGETEEKEVKY